LKGLMIATTSFMFPPADTGQVPAATWASVAREF
jgi:hypothetical protein